MSSYERGRLRWGKFLTPNSVTPIHRGPPTKGKPANVPDRPPPPGYICYRCGEKGKACDDGFICRIMLMNHFQGHWIQVCPTNDDPNFDGRPRVKRTTGIPRSFLKTIEKPNALTSDGTTDDSRQPSGVMVNAEGEWVIAEPDKASWDQYHAKAKVSAAAQEAAALGSKELQERGLECSIDKRLFVEPTKTPCCQITYCHDCINNALLENDLRCPSCSTDNILIDDLVPDKETSILIQRYEEENAIAKSKENPVKSPKKDSLDVSQDNLLSSPSSKPLGEIATAPKISTVNGTKKRLADSDLKIDRKPPGPSAEALKRTTINGASSQPSRQQLKASSGGAFSYQMATANNNYMIPQGMGAITFSNGNNYTGFPLNVAPQVSVGPTMLNTMMSGGSLIGGGDGSWVNPWVGGYAQQPTNMMGGGFQGPMISNGTYGQINPYNSPGNGFMGAGINSQVMGHFSNQQRTTFSTPTLNEEDSAYFRKPVNPHRHQARRNVNRPTDYREI